MSFTSSYLLRGKFSQATKWAVVTKALTIGEVLEAKGSIPAEVALLFLRRDMACSCSRTLLTLMESAPTIHLSLKFFMPLILSTNSLQTLYLSMLTGFLPPSRSHEQSSHDIVWYSRLRSHFHFEKVAWSTWHLLVILLVSKLVKWGRTTVFSAQNDFCQLHMQFKSVRMH